MLKVAITGGIGSGKSLASNIFKILGVPIYNSDIKAKILMHKKPELVKIIKENFGNEAYNGNFINSQYLADIVFNDYNQLKKLNRIVHPFVVDDILNWFSKENNNCSLKIVESALIFESKLEYLFDYIITVYAPKYIRIKRVKEREDLSIKTLKSRIKNQFDDKIKIAKADFVIKNHNKLIVPQIIEIHNKLKILSNHG
ncbi:MAG: dephospho-CoA kinase [Bacteroidetes bacterium GWA2_30_7]|nr:MAG: dephospho-CoA kinase [Bacteroidetes bacterium GWA2_30_7]